MNTLESLSKQEDFLKIDSKTEELLIQAQADKHIKNLSESEYFERVLVAGEMTELGLDSKKNFSDEDLENIQKDLVSFRQKTKQENEIHVSLAKYVYRLGQVGIECPALDDEEIRLLKALPEYLRQHPENGNLVYLPQIAKALGLSLDEISKPEDGQLVKKYLQDKLSKGGDEEMKAILVAGLLKDLDENSLDELLRSSYWHEEKWAEVIKIIQEYKENKQGYFLARCLPSLKKLNSVKERIIKA
jgi:hypothetical protein